MPNCKFFISDSDTPRDNLGQCQKVVDYISKGATTQMVDKVAKEQLNGGYRLGIDGKGDRVGFKMILLFLRAECNETRGCAKFEPIEETQ